MSQQSEETLVDFGCDFSFGPSQSTWKATGHWALLACVWGLLPCPSPGDGGFVTAVSHWEAGTLWNPWKLSPWIYLLGFGLFGQAGFEAVCLGGLGCDPAFLPLLFSPLPDGCPLAIVMLLCSELSLTQGGGFLSAVPTDALANKLFGVPEPSTIARSLPTTVPESPNYRNARTPRTPRTPQLKDPTQTPRFYPVVKEGRTIDAKVGPGWSVGWELGFPSGAWGGRGCVLDAPCFADSAEEEDEAQFEPPDGVPCGLGDGLSGAQAPNCLHQVLEMGMHDHGGARNGKGSECGKEGERQRLVLQGRSPVRWLQKGLGPNLSLLEGAEESVKPWSNNMRCSWKRWFPS